MIQQIKHHFISTLSLYITYKSIINPPITLPSTHSHHTSPPIPIHFPKTPQFTNSPSIPKPFPLPKPLSHNLTYLPQFPSISLTILETPILPYKSTLFQSTHITLPSPYYFPYIIYKIKPYSNPNQSLINL